jgi:hypothetical protein
MRTSNPKNQDPPAMPLKWLAGGVLVIYFVLLMSYAAAFAGREIGEPERWGQLGDFAGGMMSPLIGLAGFAGVILTLYQQHRQLQVERRRFRKVERARDKSEKVARLLAYIEKWDSPDVRKDREAIRFAVSHGRSPVAMIPLGSGQLDTKENRPTLLRLYAYFARLEVMLINDLVDEDMTKRLFGEELREWMGYVDRFDFKPSTNWQPPTTQEDRERQQWFEAAVFPLARRFGHMPSNK